MKPRSIREITNSATIVLLVIGLIASGIIFPYKQAYAHTFTGDESASFMSVIKILQAEANLVQSNLASNATLVQDHANVRE